MEDVEHPVDGLDHLVPFRHRECAAGKEIVLDIDDDEGIAFRCLYGHGCIPAKIGAARVRHTVCFTA
jgi:hypothetical protein